MGFKKDLVGIVFGNLQCISFDCNKGKNKIAYWNVKCICGSIFSISGGNLKSQTKTCKHCAIKNRAEAGRTGTKNIRGILYGGIRLNAKKRNYAFNVSIEYLDKLLVDQNFKCKLSGIPIEAGYSYDGDPSNSGSTKKWTASLDRIDSSIGYIEGNVQWDHKDINWMKQDYSQKEFIHYCKLISENNK